MALNTRSVIDPRWPFHQRSVVHGAMLAYVEVAHPDGEAQDWNPAVGDVFDGTTDYRLHYRGPARIQPNNDWRARKQKWDGHTVVEHAVRFQLPLNANEITNADSYDGAPATSLGVLHVYDVIKVIESAQLLGMDVDDGVTMYTYVIRNLSISSNSWVRTVLCDIIVNNVTPLTGGNL